ncbi:MAG: glycoside hydrolase family 43 protein [Candidatus Merdivicinus sp.]|jgi:xylan 1,4-beta-xylosidase
MSSNWIITEDLPTIRDPQILVADGFYYLTGTQPPYWRGENPGVMLWKSPDLFSWKKVHPLLERENLAEDCWYRDRFWAPEIFHSAEGKYYLTFNCRNDKTGYPLAFGIAVAEQIEGPYHVLSEEKPAYPYTNDAHLFQDDDGQVYACCAVTRPEMKKNALYIGRFDLAKGEYAEEPVLCCATGAEGEWDSIGVEGPFLVKRDGTYYLWYSSWTNGYEMGLLTARHPLGPWEKCPENPLPANQKAFRKMGHNACFRTMDGKDCICYHINDETDTERLFIEEVAYTGNSVRFLGPVSR